MSIMFRLWVQKFGFMVHRGEIVEKVVRSSGMPLTRVAQRMGKSRRWIYNAFETADLSLDLVIEFGKILHYDFSQDIPQIAGHRPVVGDKPITYGENSVDYWKEKYYALLEEHNQLLKQLTNQPGK